MGLKETVYKKLAKLFVWLLLLCAFAGVLYFGGTELYKRYQEKQYTAVHSLAAKEILRCAELASIKTRYSDVILIKKTGMMGMAKAYSMVKYSGILRAGIKDISQATYKISEDRTSIVVNLPKCSVLGNEIESQQIFDEATNLFVPITTQSIFTEIDKGRAAVEQTLVREGILDEANAHAVELFTQIFTAMGFTDIQVHLIDVKETLNPDILNTFDKVKDSFGGSSTGTGESSGSSAKKEVQPKPAEPVNETLPAPKLPSF